MSTTTKTLSASQATVRFGIQEKTARLFTHKVRESIKPSEDFPMKGNVNVDQYVVDGHEEGKPDRNYDSSKKEGGMSSITYR